MKIILKDNVAGLGFKDDVVEVKAGYGRNYLIPQGLAIVATTSALKQHEEVMRQRAHKLAQLKEIADNRAKALENVVLVIPTKISETGTIFGSVSPAVISEHLAKLGHDVDRKIIEIKVPVKEAGKYSANVHLHKEVVVVLPFEVVSEDAPVKKVEEAPKAEEAPAEEPKAEEPKAEEPAAE